MCVNCDIVAQNCQHLEAKIGEIPRFEGPTYFKIAHIPECKGVLTKVPRNESINFETMPSHSIERKLNDIYIYIYEE